MKTTLHALIAALLMTSILCASPSAFALSTCSDIFGPPSKLAYTARDSALAQRVARGLEKSQELTKRYGQKARGYAIITAAMVTSAAVSSHLTAELPKDMAFLSNLVSQVATIGIYVLGAPIWEPISSAFRKFAFGLNVSSKDAGPASDPALEKQWQRTQGQYSLNAQMSRNVILAFRLAAHANFNTARTAMTEGNRDLAVDQIADMAVQLRRLFSDLDPADASVALVVRSSFTHHVESPHELADLVLERIESYDPQSQEPEGREYYQRLLTSWLAPESPF